MPVIFCSRVTKPAGRKNPAHSLALFSRPAEKTLLALDFEDIMPGDALPQLRPVWGNTKDTLIAVTNERASAGKHSLCFYVNESTMHGYALSLPDTAGRENSARRFYSVKKWQR